MIIHVGRIFRSIFEWIGLALLFIPALLIASAVCGFGVCLGIWVFGLIFGG